MAAQPPPTDGEVNEGLSLPTDAFAEILLRLPPSFRRWARLVCRHWRDVIDDRTPRIPPPKVLAFFSNSKSASAHVVDDLADGRGRQVWALSAATGSHIDVTAVGTCNGLLCLCNNKKPGGRISLLNPATGEALRVPPLPASYRGRYGYGSGKAYTFGFHPETGEYKILHLPCRGDSTGGFSVLQAFTLGGAAWRDVAVPCGSCCIDAGLVSVGGAAHWVTKGMERVVLFDAALPVGAGPGSHCRLVEFHGRLGLAVSADRTTPARTEVWVLGDGGGGRQGWWSRRYSVRVQGVEERLAAPHFAHGGEYVLTVESKEWGRKHVYAHRLRGGGGRRLPCGEVRSVRIGEPGTAVAYCKDGYYLRTSAYVETTEPLSVYKVDGRVRGGSMRK
ncbi:unnamed protein product [Urochloa humidicola]